MNKKTRRPHLVNPSANPQTLLTVSGIYLFNVILIEAPVDVFVSVVTDEKGAKINAGLNDDLEQSQLERMLRPAIDRVMLSPGLLTIIWLPTLLQGTSVYLL